MVLFPFMLVSLVSFPFSPCEFVLSGLSNWNDWHISSQGNPFWDLVIWCTYSVYIMKFWSFVHWCYHFCLDLFSHFMSILSLKLGLIPLRPTNCVICDRSCWEIWFCGVSLYTWVKICVHAFLHLQILTYTCVYVLPRRRMLCVQACYLGDLETGWLSPPWASQG